MKSLHGLCILNGYLTLAGAGHFYTRMKEEFAKIDVSLDKISNAEIISYLDGDGSVSGKELNADFILYLDKDLYSSIALEKRGFRLFNNARAIEVCDDKMRTHLFLANDGIKMPKTISGPLNYSSNELSEEFVDEVLSSLTFPFIAKLNYGSLGKNVFLMKSKEEFIAFEKAHSHEARLYQEFISSSFGVDYRLIVIGGRFAAGMKRVNDSGDFRSNVALGGHGEKAEIPESYIKMAEKAAKTIGLDYCGVDIMIGKEKEPILCEVNSNAFISGIESTTLINVAGLYAAYIKNSLLG
jgi:gamma-F420-2:alpha-L-glutamate ligase